METGAITSRITHTYQNDIGKVTLADGRDKERSWVLASRTWKDLKRGSGKRAPPNRIQLLILPKGQRAKAGQVTELLTGGGITVSLVCRASGTGGRNGLEWSRAQCTLNPNS